MHQINDFDSIKGIKRIEPEKVPVEAEAESTLNELDSVLRICFYTHLFLKVQLQMASLQSSVIFICSFAVHVVLNPAL